MIRLQIPTILMIGESPKAVTGSPASIHVRRQDFSCHERVLPGRKAHHINVGL